MKGSMKIQGVAKTLSESGHLLFITFATPFCEIRCGIVLKSFAPFFPLEYIVLSVLLFFFYKYVSVNRGCCVHTSKINMFMIKMYIYSF